MAIIDPKELALRAASAPKFELKLHELTPEEIIPNGDRYVVEIVNVDDSIELGGVLVLIQDPNINPKDPSADPKVERRGVLVGIVLTAGNGHLLGLHDLPPDKNGVRPLATVQMFYNPGTVVFIDHNARGRNLRLVGREIRVVNQIDILAAVPKMRMKRTKEGTWEQE